MVFTTEEVTDESPSLPMTQTTVKNQVLGNNYIFLPTYLMLKIKQQNVLLELQNTNVEP